MSTGISSLVERLPLGLIVVLFLGYLGLGYYEFKVGASSQFTLKKKELSSARESKQLAATKLKSLSAMAGELKNLQDVIPPSMDSPMMMSMLVTEAKKVGLAVAGISALPEVPKGLYLEQPFSLKLKGAYPQIWSFLERLAAVNQAVRLEQLDISSGADTGPGRVELSAVLEIKGYKYLGPKSELTGTSTDQTSDSALKSTPNLEGSK